MERDAVVIPIEVFEEAETKEDLENWLMAHNPTWIEEMKKRADDVRKGEVRSLEELRERWPTRS